MADKKQANTAKDGDATKTPRQRFETTGVNRVNNVIHALEILENCADRATYQYTEAEWKKIEASIQKSFDTVKGRFTDALAGKTNKPVKQGFAL